MIDILQPCVSFNRVNTFKWYKDRVYRIDDDPGYDSNNRQLAFEKAQEWGERIPIGVIYTTDRPVLNEQIPTIQEMPLVKQEINPNDFGNIFVRFM